MKKLFTLFILTFFCSISLLHAQYKLTGKVQDTTNLNEVDLTSILIINAQDSILKDFSRTDESGAFSFNLKEPGEYILLANHPIFASYTEKINIEKEETLLEPISLTTKEELMETLVFSGERAIMIKGDTTIYAADSFNVREFATVDELLKKLPGLEVSKDGKIKAYGKEVQKMFVDGEEFFSDDPSVVAKTLQASSIDKVKVYDDQTQTAKNTGIDDGEKVKTINLTLKEDAKKGVLGSLYAGYAPNGYHEYSGKLQHFKGKRKFAAYVNGGNTNSELLSFYERLTTFGDSDGGSFTVEDGKTTITFEDNGLGTNGIPQNLNAGFNFSDKLWKDKWNNNINGTFSDKSIQKVNNGINRYIMPDTQYVNETAHRGKQSLASYRIGTYQFIELDSMKNIRVNASYQNKKSSSEAINSSNYKDIVGTLMNESTTKNTNNNSTNSINASLYYNQKLKKKGRSYNLGGSINTNNTEGESYLQSTNNLILLDSIFSLDQRKDNLSTALNYELSATYTEPLWKEKLTLALNYKFSRNENSNKIATYDINNGGPEVYNSTFSNDYDFNRTSHLGGFAINYKDKKWRSNIGISANETKFEQVNRIHSILNRTYSNFNLFPKGRVSYQFNTYSSIGLNYNGKTQQPTIDQLQPLVVNTDPTNIRIGNDALKQSFNNNFSLDYNTYSVLKSTYSYLSLGVNTTANPISQAQSINESGIRVYQYINTKSSNQIYLWGMHSMELVEDLKLRASANGNYNENYTQNNSVMVKNDYYSINPSISIDYELDTTLEFSLKFSPNYYNTITSNRKDINNQFWTYTTGANLNYQLPWKINFSTDINWVVRPQIDNNIKGNNVILWNAEISKRFLKDRSIKASIYCYDILNQNVGFNYYQSGTMTTESSWNVIKQYFMFGITWDFNSMKKKKSATTQESESEIIGE